MKHVLLFLFALLAIGCGEDTRAKPTSKLAEQAPTATIPDSVKKSQDEIEKFSTDDGQEFTSISDVKKKINENNRLRKALKEANSVLYSRIDTLQEDIDALWARIIGGVFAFATIVVTVFAIVWAPGASLKKVLLRYVAPSLGVLATIAFTLARYMHELKYVFLGIMCGIIVYLAWYFKQFLHLAHGLVQDGTLDSSSIPLVGRWIAHKKATEATQEITPLATVIMPVPTSALTPIQPITVKIDKS